MKVHARFPIVEAARKDHARNQVIHANPQVENHVGLQRETVSVANPGRVEAPYQGSRHQRVNVAIGQDHKARSERRYDFILQPVGEIRRVKKRERDAAERMPFFGLLDAFAGE